MHSVALTRDGVCLADDIEPSHKGSVEVPATADVAAIAEALLRSPWLAHVCGNATWWCSFGSTKLFSGLCALMPFIRRLGANPLAVADIVSLHLRYASQADPDLHGVLVDSAAELGSRE